MDNGPRKIMKMAQAAGAPKGAGWDNNYRVPLGTAEVSPLAQASAYATFANDGVSVANHVVREVKDRKGNVIYEAQPEKKRAVTEDIAHDVTFALSNVVEQGTGQAVQTLERPVAGKTGTKDRTNDDGSSDVVSAWFVAYTRQISTAVMYVAGNDGNGDLDNYARPGDSTFFGGTYPALTWADYMKTATKGQAVKEFPGPAYVNREESSAARTDDAGDPASRLRSRRHASRLLKRSRPQLGSSASGSGDRSPLRRRAAEVLEAAARLPPRWRRAPSGTPTGGAG